MNVGLTKRCVWLDKNSEGQRLGVAEGNKSPVQVRGIEDLCVPRVIDPGTEGKRKRERDR